LRASRLDFTHCPFPFTFLMNILRSKFFHFLSQSSWLGLRVAPSVSLFTIWVSVSFNVNVRNSHCILSLHGFSVTRISFRFLPTAFTSFGLNALFIFGLSYDYGFGPPIAAILTVRSWLCFEK
jgi:hypothetical protein